MAFRSRDVYRWMVPTTGIWTRSLKQKTNLHQNVISRAIKTLEQKKLIKSVKSVKVRYSLFRQGSIVRLGSAE